MSDAERLRARIREVVAEDGGCWHPCSGCQESVDGYVSTVDYPYSVVFQCQPGGGCRECGGIGVLWKDGTFLASFGNTLSEPFCAAEPLPGVTLLKREADPDCGCPEEEWETPWGYLHMHLNAGSPSDAVLDNGDEGDWTTRVNAPTIDAARAAIFGWAALAATGQVCI